MPIESGITTWWRNRHLLIIVMLLAFGGWFGYDGYVKYPATNRQWASEAVGIPADQITINPRVQWSSLQEMEADLKGHGVTYAELVSINEKHLGKATHQTGDRYWWVGPAMYVALDPNYEQQDPKTGTTMRFLQIAEPPSGSREGQIRNQKWFALGVFVAAGLVALRLLRLMSRRTVLDEAGLHCDGRHIAWDAMTGLRAQDFDRKYWMYLEYTDKDVTRSLRLDSLHIDKFNAIVTAICDRKGFTNPLKPAAVADEAEPAAVNDVDEEQPPQA